MVEICELKQLFNEARRLVLPDLCIVCQKRVWRGLPYCLPCIREFRRQFFMDWVSNDDPIPINSTPIWSMTVFDGIMPDWIHCLKYQDYPSGFHFIGRYLKKMKSLPGLEPVDGLIPVPLHSVRKRERGFNQSERLAREINKATGIPVQEKVLQRLKSTPTQTKLTQVERARNLEGAIVCSQKEWVKDKNLVVVDDVFTTGSTFRACQNALIDAGAKSVMGIVLAFVPKKHSDKINRD